MIVNKPKLAIAFDTILDEDFGLIQLVYNQYLDPSVFDIEKFKRSVPDIIETLYMREERNPLLSFTLPNIDKEKVDEYYNEFMNTQYEAILDNAIGTNMQNYIHMILSSREFDITIFCYNKNQLNYLNNIDEFKSIRKVIYNNNFDKEINQYYFKYVEQSFFMKDVVGCHFYYSTIRQNLNDDKSDIKDTDETRIMKKTNYINLYSLYDIDKMRFVFKNRNERIEYNNGLQ
jgi:hypothetical protein